MTKIDTKISIVFSTRDIDSEFIDHLKKTCRHKGVEVLPYLNNGQYSLTELYNKGLKEASSDTIVFCHDDIIFETKNWGDKVLKHFEKNPDYSILGVAGTDHMISGMWWEIRKAMYGTVKHTDGNKTWENKYSKSYGNQLKEMLVLDGLFLAVDRKILANGFDESFKGFHFYDISFCFENHINGNKLGLISNIKLIHKSVGGTNEQWLENKKLFESKYSKDLPKNINEDTQHIIFDKSLPKVDLHVLCWNEEKIIPHFLRHYENIVSNIIVYDNKSDDGSLKILNKHPKVTVVSYDTGGQIRDDAYLQIKNNAWKNSRKSADIVMVCDMDEFIYTKNLKEFITEFNESDSTILKPIGYDMMINDFDITNSDDLINDVKNGNRHDHFDKLCMFKPNQIKEINYNFGCHVANPTGNIKYFNKEVKLLHYKKVGLSYYLNKMFQYKKRVSKFNKDRRLGYQYNFSKEKHITDFNEELITIKKVI